MRQDVPWFHGLAATVCRRSVTNLLPLSGWDRLHTVTTSCTVHHGTMVMVPKTSLLSLDAWLPVIIGWALAVALALGST